MNEPMECELGRHFKLHKSACCMQCRTNDFNNTETSSGIAYNADGYGQLANIQKSNDRVCLLPIPDVSKSLFFALLAGCLYKLIALIIKQLRDYVKIV